MISFKENEIDEDDMNEDVTTDDYDYSNEEFFEDDGEDYNDDEDAIDYCD